MHGDSIVGLIIFVIFVLGGVVKRIVGVIQAEKGRTGEPRPARSSRVGGLRRYLESLAEAQRQAVSPRPPAPTPTVTRALLVEEADESTAAAGEAASSRHGGHWARRSRATVVSAPSHAQRATRAVRSEPLVARLHDPLTAKTGHLPLLQRAVMMSEILGRPKGLG